MSVDGSDFRATADLADDQGDAVRSCDLSFQSFGARRRFAGRIETVQCKEDNVLVRELLSTPAEGRVLVVDGGGSIRRALLGDEMAKIAITNGWAGVIINGAIRDSAVLNGMDIAIKAIGTNPRKSLKQREGTVGAPLEFGGVVFNRGELLVSDEDGIVVLDE